MSVMQIVEQNPWGSAAWPNISSGANAVGSSLPANLGNIAGSFTSSLPATQGGSSSSGSTSYLPKPGGYFASRAPEADWDIWNPGSSTSSGGQYVGLNGNKGDWYYYGDASLANGKSMGDHWEGSDGQYYRLWNGVLQVFGDPVTAATQASQAVDLGSGSESSANTAWISDYAKDTVGKYGTQFLDRVNSILDTMGQPSQYDASISSIVDSLTSPGQYDTKMSSLVDSLMSATSNLENAPQFIEDQRLAIPKLFLAQQKPLEDSITPILNAKNASGVLNSTVTRGALGSLLKERNAGYNTAIQEANLNAAQMNLDHLQNAPQVISNASTALNAVRQYDLDKQIQTATALDNMRRYELAKQLGMSETALGGQGVLAGLMGLNLSQDQNALSWENLMYSLLGGL